MDKSMLAFGVAAIGYGVYIIWARENVEGTMNRLQADKNFWGEPLGKLFHTLGWIVFPIVTGAMLIWASVTGHRPLWWLK